MSGSDRRTKSAKRDARPGGVPSSPASEESKERTSGGAPGEKKPVFRFARLDGRDTLKYEDTADK
jgi:hypothetical protein